MSISAPPPMLALVADVVRVVVVVREVRVDRAQLADAAVAHQLPGRLPLRMEAVHERFHHLQSRVRGGRRSANCSASATDSPIGFSHSTCLPAAIARIDHGTCR